KAHAMLIGSILAWAGDNSSHAEMFIWQLKCDSLTACSNHVCEDDQILTPCQKLPHQNLITQNCMVLGTTIFIEILLGLAYCKRLKSKSINEKMYFSMLNSLPSLLDKIQDGVQKLPNFTKNCSIFLCFYSNMHLLTFCRAVQLIQGGTINFSDHFVGVGKYSIFLQILYKSVSEGLREIRPLVVPEVFTTRISSGDVIYSMVFKPHNFQPGRKYPTVLSIYGGPQVQLVSNTFKGFRHMRTHMLAAHGFCVVSIDSRGSDNRGVSFQAHLMNRMGTVEIEDQVEVLQLLASQCDYMDLSRLAVTGWSYGGYLSLMALSQRPEIFKVAIAGAPVVTWNLYDTGYTERYMDLPNVNPEGYRTGSVLSYINNLPDETNKFVLLGDLLQQELNITHNHRATIPANQEYQDLVYRRECFGIYGLRKHTDISEIPESQYENYFY
ncbi:unnamed protein product, partial [Meganyctiphanes norvegica]